MTYRLRYARSPTLQTLIFWNGPTFGKGHFNDRSQTRQPVDANQCGAYDIKLFTAVIYESSS
jgi:hypothetical protein